MCAARTLQSVVPGQQRGAGVDAERDSIARRPGTQPQTIS